MRVVSRNSQFCTSPAKAGEAEVLFSSANQRQVGDRGAGDLRGSLPTWDML